MSASPITCTQCDTNIADCVCPGKDDQLRELARTATFMAFKWCRVCDKHWARCKCAESDFYIVSGGRELSQNSFGSVVPDLTTR